MKWLFPRFVTVGLLLLSGCTQERPATTRTPAAQASMVRPALWSVRDDDTTIYLFGTVHVLKPGVQWFDGGVKRAFDASDELVLEIVEPTDPQAMAATMAHAALARDGIKLSDRLNPELRQRYQAAMVANDLPWQMFEAFNPWMAGMAVAAKAAGKAVGALETVEQQLGYFAGLPIEQQVKFLDATVEGLPDMDSEFARLISHWQQGDPERLAQEMNESLEATPELAQVLLIQRNIRWAQWIKGRLAEPGTVFVAVAGKGSVQDQLEGIGIGSVRVSQ